MCKKERPERRTENGTADRITIGMDLGDKTSRFCVLDGGGEIVTEGRTATTKKGMGPDVGALARCRIAIEVGTHSPWVSRLLKEFGQKVIVANARPPIYSNACHRNSTNPQANHWVPISTCTRHRRIHPAA